MVKFNGIRAQLFLAFGALVLVINLFYARLNYLFVEATEDVVSSLLIEQEVRHLEQRWQQGTPLTHTTGHFQICTASELAGLGELTPMVHELTLYTVLTDDGSGYVTPLTFLPEPSRYLLFKTADHLVLAGFANMFSVFLFSVAAGAMVLAVLSTWFLAGKLSEPLRKLAGDVSEQQPDAPCEIGGTERPDEIGQLAIAFSQTYEGLQYAWRRERDFANDVSHELRTPIALIRNTLTLNTDGHFSDSECGLLEQSTTALHQTVEVLMALARKENLQFTSCRLRPFIERSALAVLVAHSDSAFSVTITLDDGLNVTGNSNLISLLCQNLINNGFYHGDGKVMRVYCDKGSIVFENAVSEPSSNQHYQGLGHGQYLVNRIAGTMGWSVTASQRGDVYRVAVAPILAEPGSE